MNAKITDSMVKKLVPPTGTKCEVWDTEVKCFGVRITPKRAISFVLNYQSASGQRQYTIGSYPEWSSSVARERAVEIKAAIRDGFDPLEHKRQLRMEQTVAVFAEEYLERHAIPNKRPSSVRNDRQMIAKAVIPAIGKIRLSAVRQKNIEDLHRSMKAHPYRANRVLALLSKMFNLAREWGYIEQNPVMHVQKYQEQRRESWLTDEQRDEITRALDKYSDQNAANAIRLLLFTGARAGEVLKADWTQFDLARGIWTKPSSHTKQKRVHKVHLHPDALSLLKRMAEEDQSGPLFPGKVSGSRVSLNRPWAFVCKAAGMTREVKAVTSKGKQRTRFAPTLRIHDLRHNFGSQLASSGESLQVIGALLGHTQPATTARYAHVQDEAQQRALEKLNFSRKH